MAWPQSVLLVGCGNMGGAMLAGWLASGLEPARFTILDPMLDQAPDGVELLREPPDRRFDAILLAVKPQMLEKLAPGIAPLAADGAVILSIMAGVELASLASRFPGAGGFVRIMPNLAAAIGKWPEVLECYLMTGDADYQLRVLVPSLDAFEDFLRSRLTRIEGVSEVTSSFALRPTVYRTAVPL